MATQVATTSTGYPSLAEIESRTLKPLDACWTVVVIDPIATRMLWLLVRFCPVVTPNAITLAFIGVGLAAAGAFVTGHLVWGALLYQFSFLLDCVDGKLARLRGGGNGLGSVLDVMGNVVVNTLSVFGLMFGAGGRLVLVLGSGFLVVRVLQAELFQLLPDRMTEQWVRFAPEEGWLRRHRLLFPMSFPDRLIVAFTLGPLFGRVAEALALVIILEAGTFIAKLRLLLRLKSQGDCA